MINGGSGRANLLIFLLLSSCVIFCLRRSRRKLLIDDDVKSPSPLPAAAAATRCLSRHFSRTGRSIDSIIRIRRRKRALSKAIVNQGLWRSSSESSR